MSTISPYSLITSLEQYLTSKIGCSKVLIYAEYMMSKYNIEFYDIPGIPINFRIWIEVIDAVEPNQGFKKISNCILQEFENTKQKIVSLNKDEQFALEMINKDKNTLKLIEHPTDKQRRFHTMRWKI